MAMIYLSMCIGVSILVGNVLMNVKTTTATSPDKNLKVLDICGLHEMDFTDEIHLVFNGTRHNFKRCHCWVNKGAFTLIIKELRLIQKNGVECSESTLMINSKHYTCDAKIDKHHGEMIKFEGSSPNAFIALVFGGSGTSPKTVKIALKPDGTSRLECLGDPAVSKKFTKLGAVTTTQNLLRSSTGPRVSTEYTYKPDKILEVLNMCGLHKMDFTDEIHLVFNGTRHNLKLCHCWVKKGAFTLIIKELRLIQKNGVECSESTLMINSKHYTCDAKIDKHHGEMIKFEGSSPNAFIALVFGGSGTSPKTVKIALKPDGTSRLECFGDPAVSKQFTKLGSVTTTQNLLRSSTGPRVSTEYKYKPVKLPLGDRILKAERVLPVAAIFLVLAVVLVGYSPCFTDRWGTALPCIYRDLHVHISEYS